MKMRYKKFIKDNKNCITYRCTNHNIYQTPQRQTATGGSPAVKRTQAIKH